MLQYANYDFYQSLKDECCGELEHIELPVFKPSTAEAKAAEALFKVPSLKAIKEAVGEKDQGVKDVETGVASLSLALSLGKGHVRYSNPGPGHQGRGDVGG